MKFFADRKQSQRSTSILEQDKFEEFSRGPSPCRSLAKNSTAGLSQTGPSKSNTMRSNRSIREHENFAAFTGTPSVATENPALLPDDIEENTRCGRSRNKKKSGNIITRVMRSLSRNRRGRASKGAENSAFFRYLSNFLCLIG